MVLREIMRVPMGAFDEYRALCFRQPRAMNFYMMYMTMFALLFIGKGVEKFALYTTGHQAAYEQGRRARRFYVPYFIAGYQWRFPVNK